MSTNLLTRISRFYTRWRSRGYQERRALLEAAGWLVFYRFCVRRLSVRTLGRMARMSARRPQECDEASTTLVAWSVRTVASRLPFHSNCLVRSLAAQTMLSRRGIPSTLQLGAAISEGSFSAHAWLEASGQIVTGAEESENYRSLKAMDSLDVN